MATLSSYWGGTYDTTKDNDPKQNENATASPASLFGGIWSRIDACGGIQAGAVTPGAHNSCRDVMGLSEEDETRYQTWKEATRKSASNIKRSSPQQYFKAREPVHLVSPTQTVSTVDVSTSWRSAGSLTPRFSAEHDQPSSYARHKNSTQLQIQEHDEHQKHHRSQQHRDIVRALEQGEAQRHGQPPAPVTKFAQRISPIDSFRSTGDISTVDFDVYGDVADGNVIQSALSCHEENPYLNNSILEDEYGFCLGVGADADNLSHYTSNRFFEEPKEMHMRETHEKEAPTPIKKQPNRKTPTSARAPRRGARQDQTTEQRNRKTKTAKVAIQSDLNGQSHREIVNSRRQSSSTSKSRNQRIEEHPSQSTVGQDKAQSDNKNRPIVVSMSPLNVSWTRSFPSSDCEPSVHAAVPSQSNEWPHFSSKNRSSPTPMKTLKASTTQRNIPAEHLVFAEELPSPKAAISARPSNLRYSNRFRDSGEGEESSRQAPGKDQRSDTTTKSAPTAKSFPENDRQGIESISRFEVDEFSNSLVSDQQRGCCGSRNDLQLGEKNIRSRLCCSLACCCCGSFTQRKKWIMFLLVSMLFLIAFFSIAIGAVLQSKRNRNASSLFTQSGSDTPMIVTPDTCVQGKTKDLKETKISLVMLGMTRIATKKELKIMELAVVHAYNGNSGGCLDEWERWMVTATLTNQVLTQYDGTENGNGVVEAGSYVTSDWDCVVSCDGCPDDEVFATEFPSDEILDRLLLSSLAQEEDSIESKPLHSLVNDFYQDRQQRPLTLLRGTRLLDEAKYNKGKENPITTIHAEEVVEQIDSNLRQASRQNLIDSAYQGVGKLAVHTVSSNGEKRPGKDEEEEPPRVVIIADKKVPK